MIKPNSGKIYDFDLYLWLNVWSCSKPGYGALNKGTINMGALKQGTIDKEL